MREVHHLSINSNNEAEMFSANQVTPWHGLGTIIEGTATSQEAIQLAKLDWQVRSAPMFAEVDAGIGYNTEITTHVANIRTDTNAVVGIVSPKYQLFQNNEAFDFMDELVADGKIEFHTAGALRGGSRVWMLASLPRELFASEGDSIKPYVLLTNSHDGSGSLRITPTTVRVVCQNTLSLALRKQTKAEGISIRHTGSMMTRLNEARVALGLVNEKLDQFEIELQKMVATELTSIEAQQFFESLIPDSTSEKAATKKREQWTENMNAPQNNVGNFHTVWSAYNAVSQQVDHQANYRGQNFSKQESRFSSTLLEGGNNMKLKAFETALQMI